MLRRCIWHRNRQRGWNEKNFSDNICNYNYNSHSAFYDIRGKKRPPILCYNAYTCNCREIIIQIYRQSGVNRCFLSGIFLLQIMFGTSAACFIINLIFGSGRNYDNLPVSIQVPKSFDFKVLHFFKVYLRNSKVFQHIGFRNCSFTLVCSKSFRCF